MPNAAKDTRNEPVASSADDAFKEWVATQFRASETYTMPSNTWGSSILSTFLFTSIFESDGMLVWLPQVMGLGMSVWVQGTLVMYIHDLNLDNDDKQCISDDNWTASIVCIATLAAHVIGQELCETVSMFNFQLMIPAYDAEKHAPLIRKFGVPLVFELHDEGAQPITGITCRHRLFIQVLLMSKALLAIALLFYSIGFVLYSESFSDLVLNSCATLFVLEVDEICFKLANTSQTISFFESYPSFKYKRKSIDKLRAEHRRDSLTDAAFKASHQVLIVTNSHACETAMVSYLPAFAIVGIVQACYWYWCKPGFQSDAANVSAAFGIAIGITSLTCIWGSCCWMCGAFMDGAKFGEDEEEVPRLPPTKVKATETE